MGLISNRSNFCSESYLREMRTQLGKCRSLIENVEVENCSIDGLRPIDFSSLEKDKLQLIGRLVE